MVRSAIEQLVNERELMYVSDFGRTFIETSLHKPIRITASIVLKPWECTFEQDAGDIVVSLCRGTSFGSGQHPTTRLCLKGLEYLRQMESVHVLGEKARVLDIGTGSGVLVITAVKMGIASGIGIDVDPCAIYEARGNVACNGLSALISISSRPFDKIEEKFDLMLANLRFPTLNSYFAQMVERTNSNGSILLSGIKSEEVASFIKHSQGFGLNLAWIGEERSWAAIAFYKES
jgi:ribosomal protein L11 methyltransferase